MIDYSKPLKFTELCSEAQKNALNHIRESEAHNLVAHPLILESFMEANKKITQLGIDFDKIYFDSDELSHISFGKIISFEHFITRKAPQGLERWYEETKNLKRIKFKASLDKEISNSNPLSFTLSSNQEFRNILTSQIDKIGNMKKEIKYILKYGQNDEITSKYVLIDILYSDTNDENVFNEEYSNEILADLLAVIEESSKIIEKHLNSVIANTLQLIKEHLEQATNVDNQLEYYRQILDEDSKEKHPSYFFDESGELAARYLTVEDKFKEKYSLWEKFENMKISNPSLYKSIMQYN